MLECKSGNWTQITLQICFILVITLSSCVNPITAKDADVRAVEVSTEFTGGPSIPTPPASVAVTTQASTPPATPTSTGTLTPYHQGPITIGHSVKGLPLEVYRYGTGTRKLMIIAGIHGGNEWNTIALADQMISILRGRPDLIPSDVTLYILRSLNPDGEVRSNGIRGRTNENGVDLNRNWPAIWQPTWPIDGCWRYLPVSAGSHPASEPETRALMIFLIDHQIEALISYHSAALGIFPGGQPPDPVSVNLAETLAAISDYPYPAIDTGCQFTGQLIDWASQQGIAAVDIELTNHRDTDLIQNLNILTVFVNWRP